MTTKNRHDAEWLVLKYGGTSVSSLERWETIAGRVREGLAEGRRVMVVCSALSQVSNRLEALLDAAGAGEEVADGLAELRDSHLALAADMGLGADEIPEPGLTDLLEELRRILEGIRLTREVTPRLRARVLSAGELLSTRLGATWLREQGVPAEWQDARELLRARTEPTAPPERQYLSATCPYDYDAELDRRLSALPGRVVVTQGFVARLPNGDTVLLGRGGSDTAAAYLAAKLGAHHLEIWTDVPGLFTANPRDVPEARLLLHMGYAEAGELAAKGAKVLHPRCIRPAQEHDIPIHIRCTPAPDQPGTVIAQRGPEEASIRAVSERSGIVLVSMDLDGGWQGVGVIADVTALFKEHGLSIDLLASSQTNITAALDPQANHLDEETLGHLLDALRKVCEPRLIRPTATVSLVGTGIRTILHEWAGVLELFEDESVYMVSQAANDLSLTLIVNESSAEDLVARIHRRLFDEGALASSFGPSWDALAASA